MRISDMRKMGPADLKRELENSHEELFNLRFRASTRQLTNYREVNQVKRKIARIKTLIRETELSRS